MQKKFLIWAGISAVIVVGFVLLSLWDLKTPNTTNSTKSEFIVNIVMSSSRPGCNDSDCYLPKEITINQYGTITWINKDRGFHTVTAGYYDVPDGLFDSGHVSTGEMFSYTFNESGEFHYYCRLHPWMEGKVIVN